jgi:hypothetical protein
MVNSTLKSINQMFLGHFKTDILVQNLEYRRVKIYCYSSLIQIRLFSNLQSRRERICQQKVLLNTRYRYYVTGYRIGIGYILVQ